MTASSRSNDRRPIPRAFLIALRRFFCQSRSTSVTRLASHLSLISPVRFKVSAKDCWTFPPCLPARPLVLSALRALLYPPRGRLEVPSRHIPQLSNNHRQHLPPLFPPPLESLADPSLPADPLVRSIHIKETCALHSHSFLVKRSLTLCLNGAQERHGVRPSLPGTHNIPLLAVSLRALFCHPHVHIPHNPGQLILCKSSALLLPLLLGYSTQASSSLFATPRSDGLSICLSACSTRLLA